MNVRFERRTDPPGFVVVDDVERRRVRLETPGSVALAECSPDEFRFPVERAVAVETDRLVLARRDEVYVRDDGGVVGRAETGKTASFPAGSYTLDVAAPVKLYVRVDGPFDLEATADGVTLSFASPREVLVGARSYHDRPATTLTTTDRPVDQMAVLSAFSSSLKTTTPERSYPTLRGHPPLVERGDRLDLDGLTGADTDVGLVVPPEYDSIHAVASLAFYLGATVRPGTPARIETPGFEYDLSRRGPLEDAAAAVLRQVLFLDCVVRTEGLYDVDLYERARVEEHLPFAPAEVYDRPLADQLPAYLGVSYRELKPLLPRWCLTAHVPPRPDGVSVLPHVVNELGIVRRPRGRRVTRALDDGTQRAFVEPDGLGESVNHAWFGDGQPLGATKALPAAYHHKLDRDAPAESIEITIVCNDAAFAAETGALDSVYGYREDLPYDVEAVTATTTDELRAVLADRTDFLHFVGDVTPAGLSCSDGRLDVRELDDVGVTAFLLSAPRSFEQSVALVEAGAVGGVATLGGLTNDETRTAGRGLAHLLNLGFPLGAAVELVRKHARHGDRYVVVGDGTLDIAQASGLPMVCDIRKREDGDYDLSIETYPTREYKMGAYAMAYVGEEEAFLIPGRFGRTETLSAEAVRAYLRSHPYPLRVDGRLRWNNTLDTLNL